jgi:hypothetical protein
VALAAVKKHGSELEYVDVSLQEDKEIVLIAVNNHGKGLYYA